jgi:hypothetical protein
VVLRTHAAAGDAAAGDAAAGDAAAGDAAAGDAATTAAVRMEISHPSIVRKGTASSTDDDTTFRPNAGDVI